MEYYSEDGEAPGRWVLSPGVGRSVLMAPIGTVIQPAMFVLLGALFVGYGQRMQAETLGLLEAALWGLAGGVASGLVSLMLAVKNAGYRWPWRTWPGRRRTGPREGDSEMFWARLFVFGATSLLGAFVAAAAHGQMAGPWPAFIMGVGAAPTVRGILSGVEVTARKDGDKGGGELDAGSS